MRLLFISLLFQLTASLASASAVNCANNGSDAGAIQGALNGGGTVTVTGTCSIGGTTLNINTALVLTGSATLNYSGGGYVVNVNSNNVTINGLTFNGGGIDTTNSSLSVPTSNMTVTNNVFQ